MAGSQEKQLALDANLLLDLAEGEDFYINSGSALAGVQRSGLAAGTSGSSKASLESFEVTLFFGIRSI